jgi:tetratricopeptide (TPR) repeat protein
VAERNSDAYYNQLYGHATVNLEVTTLTEYLSAVFAVARLYRRVLSRGQADIAWGIESAAYRELAKSGERPSQERLKNYLERLTGAVKHLHDPELERHKGIKLLAHLQHNGAKTCLLDFSFNPLVALWFACSAEPKSDGTVYGANANGLTSIEEDNDLDALFKRPDAVYLFDPPPLNRRILSQQSVVVSPEGRVDKENHITFVIPSKRKSDLLKELALDICENVLGKEHPNTATTYNNIGPVYDNQGEYDKALEWYQKAWPIGANKLGPNHPNTITLKRNMSIAYRAAYPTGDFIAWLKTITPPERTPPS